MALNFVFTPWSSAHLWSAVLAIVVWGVCGWGLLVPQQHRLISLAPAAAPLLMGLNSAFLYVGVSTAGVLGAAGISVLERHAVGLLAAVLVALALGIAVLADRQIRKAAAHAASAPLAQAG
jgi:predicted MFS family arabinose efflux permease